MERREERVIAWIGIDWAEDAHQVFEYQAESGRTELYGLVHSSETLQEWISQLRDRYEGKPIAVVLEQARGGLIYALMSAEFIRIYAVNPQSLAQFRKAIYPSGAKSDPGDAELLEEMVRQNPTKFRPWNPADEQTRSLRLLTEARRKFVDQMTAVTNQMTSALKTYYPQALDWTGELSSEQACAFLEKWPRLADVQKMRAFRVREFYEKHGRPKREVLNERVKQMQMAKPLTTDSAAIEAGVLMVQSLIAQIRALSVAIERYDQKIEEVFQQHPDQAVFRSFPGAGKALAPRLAAVFGADRDRFESARQVEQFSGIAPVTERSGRQIWVHRRWACSKFVRQTFHEFADQARRFCDWSKAYYQKQRERGKGHHVAIRALAYKWIRIMFRCWKDRTPYDDQRYTTSLRIRGSKLAVQTVDGL